MKTLLWFEKVLYGLLFVLAVVAIFAPFIWGI